MPITGPPAALSLLALPSPLLSPSLALPSPPFEAPLAVSLTSTGAEPPDEAAALMAAFAL
jgi:hypothetical protein